MKSVTQNLSNFKPKALQAYYNHQILR